MKALILTSVIGIATLFAGVFKMRNNSVWVPFIGLIGVLLTLVADWNTNISWYNNMVRFDNYALAFSGVTIVALIFILALSMDHYKEAGNSIADIYGLMVFSVVGAIVLSSFSNLAMMFIGVEILSIPVYILAGSNRRLTASNESALKYFLMGSFASGILLFGIALVYGATQTLDLDQIALIGPTVQSPLLTVGVLMVLSGFLFKIAAAPFHFWAPDVYEGAPGLVTSFMATIVKTAAFAAFFRLFSSAFVSEESAWFKVLWGITAATLLAGNLTALFQTNMKRLMAYSSIANAGYMLLAMLTLNKQAGGAILLYSASYTLATIAVFAVMLLVSEAQGTDSLSKFKGLMKNNPFLSVILAVALFSMAGIPPLAGFFAKYYLFAIALKSNLFYIVIVAIIASIIGAWYYLKSLSMAFLHSDEAPEKIQIGVPTRIVLVVCVLGALLLGIRPDLILHLI